jgi:putative nucleotidyltransferase with HDIG domain
MLGKLFGGGREKKKSLAPAKLAPGTTDSILAVVGPRTVPAMPGAAQKAFQLATNPQAEARDFAEVIKSDEGLSARILRIANSVYFDRGKPSTTIEDAVTVIGINELRCLLNATSLSELFPSKHPARSWFWANDVATAIISKALAQQHLPAKVELAFLGGLMHDIGKLLLVQRAPQEYDRVIQYVEREGADFCTAESTVFPFDHTEVGQLLGERWNFSPELLDVIRRHHASWGELEYSASSLSLPVIVKSADTIAHALAFGHPPALTRFRVRAEKKLDEVWQILGIPHAQRRNTLEQFRARVDEEFELYEKPAAST